MFLASTLILLLLPASLFAKSVPRADDIQNNPKRTGCLASNGFSGAMITFNNPHENNMFDYAVVTKYTTYYPSILTHTLAYNGFDPTILDHDQLCDWNKATSVHSTLGLDFNNHRGDIYWKPSALNSVDQPRDSTTPLEKAIGDSTHIPPSVEKSVGDIRRILINNPPAGDVYMFCTIILAWSTSLFGYILFMMLLMTCIKKTDRNTDEKKDSDIDEGIELDTIKAPDTDSLAETTTAAASFEDVKWDYASPQLPTDAKRPESLPAYSR